MTRPSILVTRAIFPEVLDHLRQHFEVEANQADDAWSADELAQRLQGKAGAFTSGADPITAALLARCPGLKICANMAVGYNNFDVDAMTAAGVQGTNTPDVLTETTADFGFALLMATARRMTESEHYLRAGKWTKWSYDMFAGSDIHGSTLGIIGMGRIGRAVADRARGFRMPILYHNRTRLSPDLEKGAQTGVDVVAVLAQALRISPAWLAFNEGPQVLPSRRRGRSPAQSSAPVG